MGNNQSYAFWVCSKHTCIRNAPTSVMHILFRQSYAYRIGLEKSILIDGDQ